LFRGESNVHQLALIINLKGTPSKDHQKKINPLYKVTQQLPEITAETLAPKLEAGTP